MRPLLNQKPIRRVRSSPTPLTTIKPEPGSPKMPTSPHLERGKACLRCRGRKMRCDGGRPTCGQCLRAEVGDCEYTDAGPTASQILEQNVAHLEARIRELTEGKPAGSVTLHNPHSVYGQAQEQQGNIPRLPSPVSPNFLRSFLALSSEFGFFQHVPRFMEKIRTSVPPNGFSPLPPALVYAVLLIDLVFSNDPTRETKEQQLLALALQNLSADFEPGRILYTLQTEVLISYYLFHKDRRIEGGYHAAAAVSIAVACNLHQIRSPRTLSGTAIVLPAPLDGIEEGERINAFWTVFVLDRCWTVWMQSPSVLIDETSANTQIDTPWPLDMTGYEQHLLAPSVLGGQTVQGFLSGMIPDNEHQSLLCLRAKASILYEKSAQIAAHWDPNMPSFQSQFVALDTRIDQFKAAIPTLSHATSMRADVVRSLLTIHTLCHCATIQIHAPFSQDRAPSNNKALVAANAAASILQAIPVPQLVYVDPIMGALWGSIGRILGETFMEWQRSAGVTSPDVPPPPAALAIKASLDKVMAAMQVLSGTCPLIGNELDKLRSG